MMASVQETLSVGHLVEAHLHNNVSKHVLYTCVYMTFYIRVFCAIYFHSLP